MKKIKYLLAVLLMTAILVTSVGCYIVSGQKVDKVKGTYKLTRYTYTSQYERKEGYTPTPINYIEDEEYMYEDYLVVTGSGMGYYVHKDVNTPAYAKEVTLSYQYDTENSSIVEYVIFNDALTVNKDSGINRLGVTKNSLNYSKGAFDYTQLITKKQMRSEDISVRWERVDNATDLSYVEKQLGALIKYDYLSFGVRGIYERGAAWDIATGEVQDHPYQYFYYVIDTAQNTLKATAYYALKESPTAQVVRELAIERLSEDWSSFSLDGATWSLEQPWSSTYNNEADGRRCTLSRVGNDISDASLRSLIEARLPSE